MFCVKPPCTSNLPSRSIVELASFLERLRLGVAVHLFVDGSKRSALSRGIPLIAFPPATSAWPFARTLIVAKYLVLFMCGTKLHVPVVGSYTSAFDATRLVLLRPPATMTRPSGSNAALWPQRATCME